MRLCGFDGCDRRHYARGWCVKHYRRVRQHGDPTIVLPTSFPPRGVLARLLRRSVVTATGCLEWTGYRMPDGYGQMGVGGRMVLVHRAVWEEAEGPIPNGLHLHHRCGNKACGNRAHLALLTPAAHNALHRAAA